MKTRAQRDQLFWSRSRGSDHGNGDGSDRDHDYRQDQTAGRKRQPPGAPSARCSAKLKAAPGGGARGPTRLYNLVGCCRLWSDDSDHVAAVAPRKVVQ